MLSSSFVSSSSRSIINFVKFANHASALQKRQEISVTQSRKNRLFVQFQLEVEMLVRECVNALKPWLPLSPMKHVE